MPSGWLWRYWIVQSRLTASRKQLLRRTVVAAEEHETAFCHHHADHCRRHPRVGAAERGWHLPSRTRHCSRIDLRARSCHHQSQLRPHRPRPFWVHCQPQHHWAVQKLSVRPALLTAPVPAAYLLLCVAAPLVLWRSVLVQWHSSFWWLLVPPEALYLPVGCDCESLALCGCENVQGCCHCPVSTDSTTLHVLATGRPKRLVEETWTAAVCEEAA